MKTTADTVTKASAPETRIVIEYGDKPYVIKQGEREIRRFARCDEAEQFVTSGKPELPTDEHNYLRLLCASIALKPYLEADLNSNEPWELEIDEFLSAIDALQVKASGKPELPRLADASGHISRNAKGEWCVGDTPVEQGQSSPLPWEAQCGSVYCADNSSIANCDNEADAKLIVASVNHAQAMADALRDAADWLARSTRIDDQEQAKDAREALATWKEANQ